LSSRDRPNSKRGSILVVDDESGIVDVLSAVLTDAGYRVEGATHGQDALAKLAESQADLMVLDLEMPVLDGADTLRALRADQARSRLPVVMMSGLTESIVKRRCRGYQAFLRKPFTLDELLGTVARLVKKASSTRPRSARGKARGRQRP
jgi:CheY-like chemotaxis protein